MPRCQYWLKSFIEKAEVFFFPPDADSLQIITAFIESTVFHRHLSFRNMFKSQNGL